MEFSEAVKLLIVLLLFLCSNSNTGLLSGSVEECGRPIGSVTFGKIVGGYEIGYYKYPWFVSLKRDDHHSCGATLIHEKFIVTAAHCFDPEIEAVSKNKTTYESALQPIIGVYDRCTREETQKKLEVQKVYIHEDYAKNDPFSDIALIEIKSPAKGYMPACLPKQEVKEKNRPREGFISGLGVLKFDSKRSPCKMHEARVLINDEKSCRKVISSSGDDPSKLQGAFCAGYKSGGIDACQGDSGGPLIVLGTHSKYYLLGITSFGYKCAAPGKMGIYTDVSHYVGWIKKKMEKANNNTTEEPNTTDDGEETTVGGEETTVGGEETTDSGEETTKGTTASADEWSKYPATKWQPVTITYVPWQTMPPYAGTDDENRPNPKPPGGHGPITIIINKKKKQEKYGNLGHRNYNKHIEEILNQNVSTTKKPTKKHHHNKHSGGNHGNKTDSHGNEVDNHGNRLDNHGNRVDHHENRVDNHHKKHKRHEVHDKP